MWGPYVEVRYYYWYYRYECIDVTFCLYRCRYGTGTRYQRGGPQYGPASGMHGATGYLTKLTKVGLLGHR